MRLDLRTAPPPRCPAGVLIEPFELADAALVAVVLTESYRNGSAGPFDAPRNWYAVRSRDPEWDPALVLLAREEAGGGLVAACHGWNGGFIKDLGVLAPARARGIAEALVLSLGERYRQRGLDAMELKVVARNAPARHLYARMGFREA